MTTPPRVPDASPMPGAPRLVAGLVVALALVTGLILGVAVDRGLLLRGHGGRGVFVGRGFGGRPGMEQREGVVRGRIESELGLTPAQKTQVDSILSQQMAKRRALDDSIGIRLHALLDSTRAAVDRVLTPEQRQKLATIRAHRDSLRGPGGPGPRGRFGGPQD